MIFIIYILPAVEKPMLHQLIEVHRLRLKREMTHFTEWSIVLPFHEMVRALDHSVNGA